ncbi:hypothetical protein HU765_03615 [Pseudomonas sp. SWRI81]|uniref:hypothetical protein n=1 Tax=Pseudomonas sp. SWRI81 TaxID=2745505 RepID=UPI001647B206|nr:hypothetical protein [Pseudomonas sp. SWRI81]MBC3269000.1 hypothetical protein [Pseudomonas sp. SWRI81]
MSAKVATELGIPCIAEQAEIETNLSLIAGKTGLVDGNGSIDRKEQDPSDLGVEVSDESIDESEVDEEHPIGKVIVDFIHRVLDIEDCARLFISSAIDTYNLKYDELFAELDACSLDPDCISSAAEKIVNMREVAQVLRKLERHSKSLPIDTMERSLFVNIFSCYDKFVGELVFAIYRCAPHLYKNINRDMPLSEVLNYASIDDLKEVVLDKEVESLRRKSYIEQFKEFENRFGLPLTKFESWPNFVEMGQRRNLFTHCDGIVSKQYLQICKEQNCKVDKSVNAGDQLKIGGKYFFSACHVAAEVATMLGQTLWRKLIPDDLEVADISLNRLIFDFLQDESWKNAISLSKFALSLPKISKEVYKRMYAVNYAIALKAIDQPAAAKSVLDKFDWSATTYDFRLAYEVLVGDLDLASDLMVRLGQDGEFITELSYHDWPLFRDFRETEQFYNGYEAVYGYKYSAKLAEIVESKIQDADEHPHVAQ